MGLNKAFVLAITTLGALVDAQAAPFPHPCVRFDRQINIIENGCSTASDFCSSVVGSTGQTLTRTSLTTKTVVRAKTTVTKTVNKTKVTARVTTTASADATQTLTETVTVIKQTGACQGPSKRAAADACTIRPKQNHAAVYTACQCINAPTTTGTVTKTIGGPKTRTVTSTSTILSGINKTKTVTTTPVTVERTTTTTTTCFTTPTPFMLRVNAPDYDFFDEEYVAVNEEAHTNYGYTSSTQFHPSVFTADQSSAALFILADNGQLIWADDGKNAYQVVNPRGRFYETIYFPEAGGLTSPRNFNWQPVYCQVRNDNTLDCTGSEGSQLYACTGGGYSNGIGLWTQGAADYPYGSSESGNPGYDYEVSSSEGYVFHRQGCARITLDVIYVD